MIFLVFGLVVMKTNLFVGSNDTKSSNLIDRIRRQLMQDNYDYLPSESEDFPLNRGDVNGHRSPEKIIDDYDYHEQDKQRFNITDIVVPRAHEFEEKEIGYQGVSKNDLFYYLDDDKIGLNDYKNNAVSPKVKYKVMKVKSPHPNRRSLNFRRFIQEEGEGGVALMTLDDEPFPDFKLPKSRRQYMHESDNEDMENFMDDFTFEDY
ncbi:uncharacterized protein LOC119189163 isoform X2 [Manduca sexta]|uniref:uncharacterized protein LOC119189163 isoform X2 n=1 Tax=Manduca sexta TaxID=7130 RepID=UPI00188E9132|nr:uncharacterized protein LOC119189163 isoform X2 [Manduca sexta]